MRRALSALCLGLVCSAPVRAEITFEWSMPEDLGAATGVIAGYTIYYGVTPEYSEMLLVAGEATTTGTIGVPPPGVYYVEVRTRLDDGRESEGSNVVAFVVAPNGSWLEVGPPLQSFGFTMVSP